MNEWYWVLLIAAGLGSFLFGRWRGIKDFESKMVKAGLLKPCKDQEEARGGEDSGVAPRSTDGLEECKRNLHTPVTRDDGVVLCKYCGITQGLQPVGECQSPDCRVQLFDPKAEFCQHHESNRIFGVE